MISSQTIEQAKTHGIVMLVGAGVSMDPPSALPSWYAFNDAVMDALCHRVTTYLSQEPDWLADIRVAVKQRRDVQEVFSPDYQAQIMEEQCGEDYFHALQTLDSSQRNFSHEAIAVLAKSGKLKALVTTNFDRLIEQACSAHDVAFRVFATDAQYREIAQLFQKGSPLDFLPILKIHGTVELPLSMIDTLKQRLKGREQGLLAALSNLLQHYYWVYTGFSGADLAHNPNYLGIVPSAPAAKGFEFVVFPGSSLSKGALVMQSAYSTKAHFTEARLAEWFASLLNALLLPLPLVPESLGVDSKAQVKQGLQLWARALQPYAAINMLAALFEASGNETAAWAVLHRTWKVRIPSDSIGMEYSRYQFNYARLCTLEGELEYEETLQNFFRSQEYIPESYIYLAQFYLWRGDLTEFASSMQEASTRNAVHPEYLTDASLVSARFCDIYGHWQEGLKVILPHIRHMEAAGDHPRQAKVFAIAGLLFARLGFDEEALTHIEAGERLAHSLGDTNTLAELQWARGVLHVGRKEGDLALSFLLPCVAKLQQNHRHPLLVGAYCDLIHASSLVDDNSEQTNQFFQWVNENIDKFPVWLPHFAWHSMNAFLHTEQFDAALYHADQGVQYAQQLNNRFFTQGFQEAISYLKEYSSEG